MPSYPYDGTLLYVSIALVSYMGYNWVDLLRDGDW